MGLCLEQRLTLHLPWFCPLNTKVRDTLLMITGRLIIGWGWTLSKMQLSCPGGIMGIRSQGSRTEQHLLTTIRGITRILPRLDLQCLLLNTRPLRFVTSWMSTTSSSYSVAWVTIVEMISTSSSGWSGSEVGFTLTLSNRTTWGDTDTGLTTKSCQLWRTASCTNYRIIAPGMLKLPWVSQKVGIRSEMLTLDIKTINCIISPKLSQVTNGSSGSSKETKEETERPLNCSNKENSKSSWITLDFQKSYKKYTNMLKRQKLSDCMKHRIFNLFELFDLFESLY